MIPKIEILRLLLLIIKSNVQNEIECTIDMFINVEYKCKCYLKLFENCNEMVKALDVKQISWDNFLMFPYLMTEIVF